MPDNMIFFIQSIIMGIVEGITEFLPISSTGHLIVIGDIIGFPKKFGETFEVVIQLGAILAVIYYYRVKILESFKALRRQDWGFRLWLNIMVAFMPAAFVGLLGHGFIKTLFSPVNVAIAMIVGAILLYVVQNMYKNNKIDNLDKMTLKQSFIVGVFQCLSLFPGMSRSASTIMGGMISGFNVKAAAEFSFFLAIPTMLAATAYELVKGLGEISGAEWGSLAIGFAVSFVVALLVIKKFLGFLAKRSLNVFVYYRLLVGVLLLVLVKYGVVSV